MTGLRFIQFARLGEKVFLGGRGRKDPRETVSRKGSLRAIQWGCNGGPK
jgi:hypothetical protein